MISSMYGVSNGNCSQILVRSERCAEDLSLVFCDPEKLDTISRGFQRVVLKQTLS